MLRKRDVVARLCLVGAASSVIAMGCAQQVQPKVTSESTPPTVYSSALGAPQQVWPPTIQPVPSATMEATTLPIPAAATATWLSYPAAGVNTKLESYTSSDGILNPPGAATDSERVFLLEPYSNQAGADATNTLYVIAHGYDDGTGVMNRIMSRAKPGQIFVVTTQTGKVCYKVDRITKEKKQDIADAVAPASVRRPGWVVFITCYAAPGDPSTVWGPDSSVLYAQMQPCAA